jgi:hypothetical protein
MARVRGMGGGGHDELVRGETTAALGEQREALVYAEAVLFVDDHKAEALEHHVLLEYGMGAEQHLGFAASKALQDLPFLLRGCGAPPAIPHGCRWGKTTTGSWQDAVQPGSRWVP